MKRRHVVGVAGSFAVGVSLWGPANLAAPSPNAVGGGARVADGGDSRPPSPPPDLLGQGLLDASERNAGPRAWRLVLGRHWQIVAPPGEEPDVTDAREGGRGACPAGMVEVAGKMKQHALLDDLQMQACTRWIDRKWPERCGAYDRDRWLALSKDLPTRDVRVCVDRFEYPNRKGEFPVIMASWYEARGACASQGKRLCTEDEWTFACEGEEATPYPNGYERDPEACLNDRPWREFHGDRLSPRTGDGAKAELDRLWQGLPSGARPLCRSVFGVYDMTGNVDEWTRSSVPGERPSVLKGGYWGPVRTRCRPATKAHGEDHMFYQQGFRCCADRGSG